MDKMCKVGYGWSSTKCAKCTLDPFPETGNNCSTSLSKLSSCMDGYMVGDDDVSCVACSTNCAVCSEAATCEECMGGFTIDEEGKNCIECA